MLILLTNDKITMNKLITRTPRYTEKSEFGNNSTNDKFDK